MKTMMSDEALSFGRVVDEAIASAGGVSLARVAESAPAERDKIAALLADLGVWDLDATADDLQAEAAAAVCRAAGRNALPYPVAERLSGGHATPDGAVALVSSDRGRVNHADLPLSWTLCDGGGRVAPIAGVGTPFGGKLGRFVCPVEAGAWAQADVDPTPLLLTLQAWTLLGMLEQASQMTYRYVSERHQFGHPLAHFQNVQFVLTDVAVAVDGLAELARYTLWSVNLGGPHALQDAVALRVAALEAAEFTFRVGHQLHGAIGFCDETPISWLSRMSQPLRRLPIGLSQTEAQLVALLDEVPFGGPFQREVS
jgi:hypothetical protein